MPILANALTLSNGIKMPSIGLGTWKLSGKECTDAVIAAYGLGYRHFDTAEIYRNEQDIGEAMESLNRKQIFLTSKVWPGNLTYQGVLDAFERSTAKLRTEYIDLYLIHWPGDIPLEESIPAFAELYLRKKIRAFGVSNFSGYNLEQAIKLSKKIKLPLTVNQIEMHPGLLQSDVRKTCQKNRIAITAYSPLGLGHLLKDKTLLEIAAKNNKTVAQICLNWLLDKGVAVIPKAGKTEHLRENLLLDFKLPRKDAAAIDNMGESLRYL